MAAYYNENDPKTAAWLRELIKAGHIAPGDVDERSIEDVEPMDVAGYTQCHFFAGIGGWSYALRLAGWSDTRNVWTGSCPCQPFSAAGKGKGFADERHLWPSWFWLIEKCRPPVIFGEQVDKALSWLDLIFGDLEPENYACGAAIVGAHSVRAPHIRQRIYWVADSQKQPLWAHNGEPHEGPRQEIQIGGHGVPGQWDNAQYIECDDGAPRPVEPGTFPLAHGVPGRVGLLRGYGNAIVPQDGAAFIEAYLDVDARRSNLRAGSEP